MATQSANNHQDHQLIISNKTKANKKGTSAKSNLYYYHDQHLHNNNDALQTEEYCTAQNKSLSPSPPPHDSFQHTTFHSNSKKSTNHHHATSTTPNTIPSVSSSANHTALLSAQNLAEFEIKSEKNYSKKSKPNRSGSLKNGDDKIEHSDDYKVDTENYYCDKYDEVLTSHYILSNHKLNEDRRSKKSKR